ncbi:hypothetical protein D3C75_1101700 [compost metagenome]
MQRVAMAGLAELAQVVGQLLLQPVALLVTEPAHLGRAVRQQAQGGPGQQHCRGTDTDEQPLPAMQAVDALKPQQRTRKWPGDQHGQRLRENEEA